MTGSRRVAICGGGVAALEAMLALRAMLVIRPHIDLIAPNRRFSYEPMSVAEPFGLARTRLFDLDSIAEQLGVELHVGTLAAVDDAERSLTLATGERLSYDAAIVAVGAQRTPWLAGAMSFGGADDADAFAQLLGRLELGAVSSLAFAAPGGASWTLPLYELALLTASRLAERGIADVRLSVITPEEDPLALFGSTAGRMLRDLLADRGITLRADTTALQLSEGVLRLSSGEHIEVDTVVALPRLQGPRVGGLPLDAEGFILVDEHCRVPGLENVYAAGDGTSFAIKQGGIATQQADAAAEAIASSLGAPFEPAAFDPVLRGLLLTGVAPIYLRSATTDGGNGDAAAEALWWPPTKIAGRYLGPYLAGTGGPGGESALEERPAPSSDVAAQEAAHRELLGLAIDFAEADARAGDLRSALGWLDVIERLEGVLPEGFAQKREAWQRRLDS